MAVDLFKRIDNTVLDLQASHGQTYDGLFKKLARLLQHENLEEFNKVLIRNVDYPSFLVDSHATNLGRGMRGTSTLQWTGNDEYDLGLKYILIQKIGNDSDFAVEFSNEFFSSSDNKITSCIHNLVRGLVIPFVRDYKDYIGSSRTIETKLKGHENNMTAQTNKKIFVVHGHDNHARDMVANFLERNDFDPIVLHERANGGRTIIEKIEANSDVGFAVILLTPDDLGKAKGEDELQFRARQNVILELGYFIGKLGRNKVCAFKSEELEIPTDFSGIMWSSLDSMGAWKQSLWKELKEAGYEMDSEKMLKSLSSR